MDLRSLVRIEGCCALTLPRGGVFYFTLSPRMCTDPRLNAGLR